LPTFPPRPSPRSAPRQELLREALGPDASQEIQRIYADVLLDSLVHEVNAVLGLFGEPENTNRLWRS
jgi:hypothetical protein